MNESQVLTNLRIKLNGGGGEGGDGGLAGGSGVGLVEWCKNYTLQG